VSYGKVAYHTAYLKANFPGEYMTAILSAEAGDVEKVAESVKECKRMGINVLPPDINSCFKDFTLVKESEKNIIRFGLVSIKNFGEGIANTIINEREKNGKFSSLGDFLARIKDRNLNKKSLEALIYSGALDSFGERGEMLGNIESLLEFNKEQAKGEDQFSLFGNLSGTDHGLTLTKKPEMEMDEKLKWEKELLGLYVSGHPLDKYKSKMEGRIMTTEKIKTQMQEGMIAVATGLIEEVKPMLTKNGEKMLFIKITDYVGSIEIVAFPRIAIKNKDILTVGKCLSIKGKVSKRNNQSSLIAEEAREL
jgi:DNA polymerase-3 subunit alpha